MSSTVDWPAIRNEYEAGASKQALSIKYGITRQAIIKHARKEHWITPIGVTVPSSFVTSPVTDDTPVELAELSPLEIVEKALLDLSKHLENAPLDLKSHKLFADALSQYIKLKLLIPAEQQDLSPYDMRELLSYATDEQLAILKPILAELAAKKAEAEEKIKPLQRTG